MYRKPKERMVFNPTNGVVTDPCCTKRKYFSRRGKYAHLCFDWNEMLIDETDPEFETCTCGIPDVRARGGHLHRYT